MGNRTNSKAMRLGITQSWDSTWYASGKKYVKYLHEDLAIRDYISEKLKNAGLGKVDIRRPAGKLIVTINVARPGVVIGRQGSGIERMKGELNKLVGTAIDLRIMEVQSPDLNARIVARSIANGIEKRQSPKPLARNYMNKAMQAGAKGIVIWISGRINGHKDARRLKFVEGSVPTQTLRADVDYSLEVAHYLRVGLLGVKVWINR